MRQVVTVILCLGVVLKKDLDAMPRALYLVRLGSGFWIFETEAMTDGAASKPESRDGDTHPSNR